MSENIFPNWYVASLLITSIVLTVLLVYVFFYTSPSMNDIAQDFARGKEYSKEEYNCYDYSVGLIEEYEKKGYTASLISGYHKGEERSYVAKLRDVYSRTINGDKILSDEGYTGHAWVEVCAYIEATSGRIIPKNNVKWESD